MILDVIYNIAVSIFGFAIGRCKRKNKNTNKTEQQYSVADSAVSCGGPAKSFVPCKVCGDKASGYHYGVTSCEGCKGFFRRSIQKQIEYRCLRDGKCLVIRLNRNRCQYCRFKKCLQVGMSRDSVRYGRVPKRSRELCPDESSRGSIVPPLTPPCGNSQSSAESVERDGPDLALYDVILCVSQAHRAHSGYTEELTGVTRRPVPMPPPSTEDCEVATSASDTLEQQRIWLWQQYASRITPAVQRVVEFAKRVPGFCELSQDDQLILIKLGFFEVWLTHVARTTTDASLMFDDGFYLTKQQMEVIYDTEFVTALLRFTHSLNSLSLSDTELGLFSALILLACDRSGVTGHKAITRSRERVVEALRVQVSRNRPTSITHIVPALEAKIPELRALGVRHCNHLEWFRENWTSLRLPPLFAEIFDIPKEDDMQ